MPIVPAADIARVLLIAGLFDQEEGWLSGDEVSVIATSIGAETDDGDYSSQYDSALAIACIQIVRARGVRSDRADNPVSYTHLTLPTILRV